MRSGSRIEPPCVHCKIVGDAIVECCFNYAQINPVVCGGRFSGARTGVGDVWSIGMRVIYGVQEGVVIGREGGRR